MASQIAKRGRFSLSVLMSTLEGQVERDVGDAAAAFQDASHLMHQVTLLRLQPEYSAVPQLLHAVHAVLDLLANQLEKYSRDIRLISLVTAVPV
jgi:hypothetical protein